MVNFSLMFHTATYDALQLESSNTHLTLEFNDKTTEKNHHKMEAQKILQIFIKIIILLLLTFIGQVFSIVNAPKTSFPELSCNLGCSEEKSQHGFPSVESVIHKIISTSHLKECYILQIRNNNDDLHCDEEQFGEFPSIDVNLDLYTSLHMFDSFKRKERQKLIKFQDQCIIFMVRLVNDDGDQDGDSSSKHISRLVNIFQHTKFQAQTHRSYVFIRSNRHHFCSDQENNSDQDNKESQSGEIARTILTHPALNNYEYKTWLQIQNEEKVTEYEKQIQNQTELQEDDQSTVESLIIQFHPAEKMTNLIIYHFCSFCRDKIPWHNSRPILKSVNEKEQNPLDFHEIFPDTLSDLHGREVHVTTAMALPFAGILGSEASGTLRMEGMQAMVLESVASALNFTYILDNTSGSLTGAKLANGTWVGTIGEVYYGRSDIGLNVAPSTDRYEVADFTVPVYYGFLVLVSTKPSPFFAWKAIFYPFEINAWLGIISSTLITVLSYRFFLNHSVSVNRWTAEDEEKKRGKVVKRRKPKNSKVSFIKVCYITFGSLLEQGVPFDYFSSPSKVYALFWLLFTIVATCAYKSKLFSYLTFPIIQTPPSTFHELSVSDYTWGLKSLGGIALLFITKSPVSYIREVGEKMEISTDKYSCIDKTFTDRFVCIIYRAYYDYLSDVRYWKISHKFHVSDYVTPPVGSAWVIPKSSPLLHPLNKNIFRQFEMGLSGTYLEKYIKQMALKSRKSAQASKDSKDLFDINTKYKRETITEKPLEFVNLYASFIILFFGSGISLSVLLLELWRTKNEKDNQGPENVVKRLRKVKLVHGVHFFRKKATGKRVRFGSATTRILE